MSRTPSLTSVREGFQGALNGAYGLYLAVADYCPKNPETMQDTPLHFRQARRVLALAFLWVVAAWEDFAGDAVVRYIAGAKSPSGWCPSLAMGPATSLRKAFQLVAGSPDFDPSKNFLNWGTGDMLRRTALFLKPGNRLGRAVSTHRAMLDDALAIRNRVAHSSTKAREAFKKVALRLRGRRLYQSYSVGDLLLEPRPAQFPRVACGENVFLCYLNLFLWLQGEFAPSQSGSARYTGTREWE